MRVPWRQRARCLRVISRLESDRRSCSVGALGLCGEHTRVRRKCVRRRECFWKVPTDQFLSPWLEVISDIRYFCSPGPGVSAEQPFSPQCHEQLTPPTSDLLALESLSPHNWPVWHPNWDLLIPCVSKISQKHVIKRKVHFWKKEKRRDLTALQSEREEGRRAHLPCAALPTQRWAGDDSA